MALLLGGGGAKREAGMAVLVREEMTLTRGIGTVGAAVVSMLKTCCWSAMRDNMRDHGNGLRCCFQFFDVAYG